MLYLFIFDIVRIIRPPSELMKKDKQIEISGEKCVAADVSTACAAIIKANIFLIILYLFGKTQLCF